jgi:hypothetical protein
MRNTMNHHPRHSLATDLVLGGLAGAAATWGMGQVTSYLYEKEAKPVRQEEDAARGGETAYETAAARVAGAVGEEMGEQTQQRAGKAIHFALGIGAGALYGALRERAPGVSAARGLGYAAGMWLVLDEGANAVLGLTPGPGAFPWQTHARGLAGHLTYGLVLDSVLRLGEHVV